MCDSCNFTDISKLKSSYLNPLYLQVQEEYGQEKQEFAITSFFSYKYLWCWSSL